MSDVKRATYVDRDPTSGASSFRSACHGQPAPPHTPEVRLVPSIGGYAQVGASAALVADPAEFVLTAAAGSLLLVGYLVAVVVSGAVLVARRDVT